MESNRRHFLKTITAAGATLTALRAHAAPAATGKSAANLKAPKMEKVRWGFIGLGARGGSHLGTILSLENAVVTAICDNHPPTLKRRIEQVRKKQGGDPAAYGANGDANAWKEMIKRDDIDAVLIASPWELHTPNAVAVMKAGKHAFVEVPAALTIEECWQLVDTSENTQKHCMMLENVNYGREEMMLLNMCRQNLFGELLHGEAAYLHELRGQMRQDKHGTGSWRTHHYATDDGNLYPTHGLGPVAHYMNVNRGDLFDHLVSMSTPARGRDLYAEEHFPADHKWNKIKEWKCGDLSTSLIKLATGKTIMVQWDETSPRPYSRHNYVQGTRGAFGGFPNRIAVDYDLSDLPEPVRKAYEAKAGKKHNKRTNYHGWDNNMGPWFEAFDHPLWKKVGELAKKHGGHGGMDYIMLWRVMDCLRNGEALDQSVYDAAAWSAVTPLSAASVRNGSAPQKFPDFTRGHWKTTAPLPVIGA